MLIAAFAVEKSELASRTAWQVMTLGKLSPRCTLRYTALRT